MNNETNYVINNNESKNNSETNYGINNNESKNNNDTKKLFICIVIMFVICLIGIGMNFYNNQNVKEKDNTKDVELKYTETISNSNVNTDGVYVVDVSQVVDKAMPSIVSITSKTLVNSGYYRPGYFGDERYSTGAGSGIIVSKSDTELMILTNKHVIEDADELTVTFINDKMVDAKVKGFSTSKDIAIITIPLSSLDEDTIKSIKIATIGKSTDLKVGQGVIAIGNSLGYGQSVTTGVISALNREVTIDNNTTYMIQTDAAINGGNSGGALLNSKGEVIGINSAKYSSTGSINEASIEGMGFAIPISDVSDLINNIMNGTNLTEEERGYLGVSGYMVTEEYSQIYNMPTGFYISTIVQNSGADKAGLSIGNIVTEINGKKVKSFSTITSELEDKKAGVEITLKIKYIEGRDYLEKEIKVKLSSYEEVN